jgi:hypothetical protein
MGQIRINYINDYWFTDQTTATPILPQKTNVNHSVALSKAWHFNNNKQFCTEQLIRFNRYIHV